LATAATGKELKVALAGAVVLLTGLLAATGKELKVLSAAARRR